MYPPRTKPQGSMCLDKGEDFLCHDLPDSHRYIDLHNFGTGALFQISFFLLFIIPKFVIPKFVIPKFVNHKVKNF